MDENDTARRWVLYEASSLWVPKINPQLATEIGLIESLVLTQVAFLLRLSKSIHDGRYWVHKTAAELQKESLPFINRSTITRTLDRLCNDHHLLDRRNDLNKRKDDRTFWYALNIEYVSQLTSVVLLEDTSLVQNAHCNVQNAPTLPESTTDKDSSPSYDGGTPTPKRIPTAIMTPMKNAIANAFGWTAPTKTEWGRIQKVAKDLILAGLSDSDVAALYGWCKRQGWPSFSPNALPLHVSEWRGTRNGDGTYDPHLTAMLDATL